MERFTKTLPLKINLRFKEWTEQGTIEQIGPTRRGKETKIMLLVDAHGIPLSIDTESVNVNEVRLIERLVDNRLVTEHQPERRFMTKPATPILCVTACNSCFRRRWLPIVSAHSKVASNSLHSIPGS